jgi:peptidoglycan hydrolase CwlO-like protein
MKINANTSLEEFWRIQDCIPYDVSEWLQYKIAEAIQDGLEDLEDHAQCTTNLESEVDGLEDDLEEANRTIESLEDKIAELKKGIDNA